MLFNSIEFLIFFPTVCLIYYLLPKVRWRNLFLLGASYYFYMNWKPVYALLLLASTAITYGVAIMVSACSQRRKRRMWLAGGIVANLLILFFFKYFRFAAENITAFFRLFGIGMSVPDFDVLLPVGISFYIFQALGYSIDVYRGTVQPVRDFFRYALFVSFFPQLVAGPIERSTNLLQQFSDKHRFNSDRAIQGMKLMLWGYFLKLVLADRCADYVDTVYNHLDDHSGYSTAIATILFCFQIYGDFAGYTYIAIGAARIMGFTLMDNFMRPYFAATVTDFWKRWHISLTKWLTSYVYIPLGGSRCSKLKHYRNVLLTFLISGVWHGANWTFIFWGGMHGGAMVTERALNIHQCKSRFWYWPRVLVTFIFVGIAWLFFRVPTFADGFTALKLVFTPSDLSLAGGRGLLLYCIVAIAILFVKEYREERSKTFSSFRSRHPELADNCWMIFLLVCILTLGVFDGGQFIYFQF